MGMVKWESKHYFLGGHVWIIWDAGEENEFGYEIDFTGEEGFGGVLTGICNWSFGYEDWSREIWEEWGNYLSYQLQQIEGKTEDNEKALEDFIIEIEKIDCTYTKYHPDNDRTEEIFQQEHLKDLDKIKSLIEENKHLWQNN